MDKQIFTDVYYAQLPLVMGRRAIYPPERQTYIMQASNEKVARQRYYVWLLLERAVELSFSKCLAELQLQKTKSEKWLSPVLSFSLSHGDNAVAVAVSNAPVGVDIQAHIPQNRSESIVHCALTETERLQYENAINKEDFLTALWTRKESIFKLSNDIRFAPNQIQTDNYFTQTQTLTIGKERYFLSTTAPIRNLQEIQL